MLDKTWRDQTLAAKLEKLDVLGVIVHPTLKKLEVYKISWRVLESLGRCAGIRSIDVLWSKTV